jgi:hypothetical protein
MKKAGVVLVLLGLWGAVLFGVTAQKWVVLSSDDVLKGKCQGVSLSSDGELFLAPKEESLEGPAEEFYLCMARDQEGSFFLGTGHAGKIFKVTTEGKPELYFQAGEMDVTSLVVGPDGVLYAATSPNGKVYKISDKGKGDVFFNPGEKYIWALLPGEGGKLLAAVGESGGVYEISPEGDGRQILKVQENHILCLKRDKNGDLFAGSGGNGLVYRLSKSGKVAVLFESPFEEIKSLDFDGEGNVIAAASGTPAKGKKDEVAWPAAATFGAEITVSAARPASETSAVSSSAAAGAGREPSAVYIVSPEGASKKIWSSNEELIYAVLWRESEKRALIGTGGNGRVYSVDKDEKSSLLLQKASEQVYSFLALESRVYVLSNNPPHFDVILPEQRFDGEYLSAVQNAKLVSTWGQIGWQSELPQSTSLQLQTRSGNSSAPNAAWSDWSPPYQRKDGEQILSPKARFLQFRALLKTNSGRVTPRLQRITLNYLQTNVAPVIKQVEALPPNVVFLKPPEMEDVVWGAAKSMESEPAKPEDPAKTAALAKKTVRKGLQTVVWEAADENGDSLRYTLLVKKEGETAWRLLENDWTNALYAFDTASLPDGLYRFKVVASDAPSNAAGLALTAEKVSGPVTVDNTPPVLKSVSVTRDRHLIRLSFQAEANLSPIVEARCFIRPGEWVTILPVDGICDSRQETFNLSLSLPANADNLLVLQVKDEHGNIGVYRQAF